MSVTEPNFVKLMLPLPFIVSSSYTKFDGNPADGLVAVTGQGPN
jgi:hypothetical protein